MNKNEIESYACLVLKTFLPNTFGDLQPADCPDLQGDLWGVEVTRAEESWMVEADVLTSRIAQMKDRNCIPEEKKKKYGIRCYPTDETKPLKAVFSNNGLGQRIDERRVLWSLTVKLCKLNKGHYKKMRNYGLFIYSNMYCPNDNPCNQEILLSKMTKLSERYPVKYSKVFLLDIHGNFFVFDLSKNTSETYLYGSDFENGCSTYGN